MSKQAFSAAPTAQVGIVDEYWGTDGLLHVRVDGGDTSDTAHADAVVIEGKLDTLHTDGGLVKTAVDAVTTAILGLLIASVNAVTTAITGTLKTAVDAVTTALTTTISTALALLHTDEASLLLQAQFNAYINGWNTYSTTLGDFTATPTAGGGVITLSVDSVGGQAIDTGMIQAGRLVIYDTSASRWKFVTLDAFTWVFATKVLTITDCTGYFALAADDVVRLAIIGPMRAYNGSQQALDCAITNYPGQSPVPTPLVNTTNVGAGPTYYPTSAGVQETATVDLSIAIKSIEGDAENNVYSLEICNDTGPTIWVPYSGVLGSTGAAAAAFTATGAVTAYDSLVYNRLTCKYWRLKFVGGASATNTVIADAQRCYHA